MPAEERITVQITEPPIIPNYCLDFVPSWAGQLHYQPQALESARQGPGPSAPGTGRGLPAHDLRREPRGGGRGAGRLRTQVAAALQGRGLKLWQAGDELFTFTAFPSSQWKALRTTNALERVNEEFRRRTKTQASPPTRRQSCSCCSDCCAADRSNCATWSAGMTLPPSANGRRQRNSNLVIRCSTHRESPMPPLFRQLTDTTKSRRT